MLRMRSSTLRSMMRALSSDVAAARRMSSLTGRLDASDARIIVNVARFVPLRSRELHGRG
jgi:hypothetical protein